MERWRPPVKRFLAGAVVVAVVAAGCDTPPSTSAPVTPDPHTKDWCLARAKDFQRIGVTQLGCDVDGKNY